MKKFFALVLANISGGFLIAQDDVDAMRYSQTAAYGDSRFMAMGGAFGALGANVSCMNFNPAGIAMYRKGELVFTPGVRIQNAKAVHYDSSATDFSTKLDIANLGFVYAWDQTNPYPPQSKLYPKWNERNAFGISYNRLADFNFNTTINGTAANSSIINDFVNAAQGLYPGQLNGTYEWLAYQTYLINPNYSTPSDSNHYYGMMLPNTPLLQQKTIKQSGRMSEIAFSFAHSFSDKLYLGVTLGIPKIIYSRNSTYTEIDSKKGSADGNIFPFKSLKYEEQLVTASAGFNANLKLGVIYRLTEQIRIGAYAHSPSVINLTDNYDYKMTANYDSASALYPGSNTTYSSDYSGFYKYKIYTPARGGVSIAYIYQKALAMNVDAEFVGYNMARYKTSDNALDAVNLTIQKKYASTVNVRAGAEYNAGPVIVRAGYAGYGSPFGNFTGKFARSSYSGGIGFKRRSNTYFDLGFIYTTWREDYYLYDPSQVQATALTHTLLYFTATLGIKFN